jgi:hypothetical protein
MNNHLAKYSHRCGYCGLVGCTLSFKKRSGYGIIKGIGAKSEKKVVQQFKKHAKYRIE